MAALRRLFGRPTITIVETPTPVAPRDPWADHPMSCKCYFHR